MTILANELPKRYSTALSDTGPTPAISQNSPGSSDPRRSASALTWSTISARGVPCEVADFAPDLHRVVSASAR
jgi:hypothetical protein